MQTTARLFPLPPGFWAQKRELCRSFHLHSSLFHFYGACTDWRRIPNARRRRKPIIPFPRTTITFISNAPLSPVGQCKPHRHNNHSRQKQNQTIGTKTGESQPQAESDCTTAAAPADRLRNPASFHTIAPSLCFIIYREGKKCSFFAERKIRTGNGTGVLFMDSSVIYSRRPRNCQASEYSPWRT